MNQCVLVVVAVVTTNHGVILGTARGFVIWLCSESDLASYPVTNLCPFSGEG